MAAIELGVPYYIYNPSVSQYCALNAPADPNFVGYVTDITGLDDAGVRENAQVIVAGDGGHHGPFWRDRRPWTLSGIIMPTFPLLARDKAQELLEGILGQAMQADGYLTWTPADSIQRMLAFRKQQPVRITKGQSNVEKLFQVAAVTADFRVVAWQVSTLSASNNLPGGTGAQIIAQNLGNADAAPKFVLSNKSTGNIVIQNVTTNKSLVLDNPPLSGGDAITVDLTGPYPTIIEQNSGLDYSGYLDALQTDWTIALAGVNSVANGNNTFNVTGVTSCTLSWRHSWV